MLATADADYTVPTLVGRSTGGGLYLLVEDVGDLRCGDRGRRDGGARAGNSRTGHRASPRPRPRGPRVVIRDLRTRRQLVRPRAAGLSGQKPRCARGAADVGNLSVTLTTDSPCTPLTAAPARGSRRLSRRTRRARNGRDPGAASRATPALAPCWRAGVAGGRRTTQDSQRDSTSVHVIHHPSRREPSRAVPAVCIHEAASVASEPVAPSLGGAAAHAHPRRRRPRGARLGGWRGSGSAARGGASEGHPRHRGYRRRRVPPPQAPRADTSLPKAMAARRRPHP
jgi:hypothetical protein